MTYGPDQTDDRLYGSASIYMDMHRTCMMHNVPSYIAVRI